MPDEIRINRVTPPAVRPEGAVVAPSAETMLKSPSSKMPWIILIVVVVAIVVLGFLFRDKLFTNKAATNVVKSSGYEAVFLTNGQVYFGKLSDANKEYATLKDIFYLQVIQQPGLQSSGQTTTAEANTQSQISLVKLGNELHGPVDEMHISKSQILFYEDLKEDGQVAKAIKDYKANPQGTTQQQAPAAQTPTTPQAPAPAK